MACNQTLSGLAKDCLPSMGGIVEALIANFEDVVSVTETANIITAITMADTKKFHRYAFNRNTGSLTSTLNVDEANGVNYVSTDLVLVFSRMETAKRIEINALAQNDLAVIVRDANGKYWYLGQDAPVKATAGDAQSGTARGDRNGYSVTLQDNSFAMPAEVDEDIIAALIA